MNPSHNRLSHQSVGRAVESAFYSLLREALEMHYIHDQDPLFPADLEEVRIQFRHVGYAESSDVEVQIVLDGHVHSRRFKHVNLDWKRNLVLR